MKHLHYAAKEHGSLGELFDFKNGEAYARSSDPDTSRQAAEQARGDRAARMEALALRAIRDREPAGATNHEVSEDTGVSLQTITPRMKPLRMKGLIYDSGQRRHGATNRMCIVWRAIT